MASRVVRTLALGLAGVVGLGALAGCGSPVVTPSPSLVPTATATSTPTTSPTVEVTAATDVSAPLRDLAGGRYFGTAVQMPYLVSSSTYSDITSTEFSSVTPENAMEWDLVEPTQGNFDWDDADSIVAWAQSRGILVRGHTLVWDQQLPTWLTSGNFDAATLTNLLHDHITTEVSRYAGQIYAWDVVNEAFNSDGSLRRTIWEAAMGPDYIARVFEWAHIADPKAKLYINDYGDEGLNAKSDAIYELVKSLRAQGVPIDGVGMQAHFDAAVRGSFPPAFADNIKRFADLGVDVAITELDVRIHTPPLEDELDRQTAYYVQAVTVCFSTPGCVGVTVWEWSDRYSWIPSSYPGEGTADLWDSNLHPKPALTAVKQAILDSR